MDRRRFIQTSLIGALAAVAAACSRAIGAVATSTSEASSTTGVVPVSTAAGRATTTSDAPSAEPTTTTARTTAVAASIVEVISRAGWGASPPSGEFTEHTIERVTVHHTARRLDANRDAPRAIRIHQQFHQVDRGWSDIAYHFVVDAAGNVYEGRPIGAVGDTGTDYDPTGHFLVACEGNFDDQEVPAAQLSALISVVGWAINEFALGADAVVNGHRDVATTSCPGDALYPFVADGSLLRRALDVGRIDLLYLSDEASAASVAAIEA